MAAVEERIENAPDWNELEVLQRLRLDLYALLYKAELLKDGLGHGNGLNDEHK